MYVNTVPGYSRSSSAQRAFLPSLTVVPGTKIELGEWHLRIHWACIK